jgi:putative membrane protein
MLAPLPYCGSPPVPGALLERFNLDPRLLVALLLIAAIHIGSATGRRGRVRATAGWLIATVAFVSPLCALSVALFAARIAQHMLLILASAPLIALALPPGGSHLARLRVWSAGTIFLIALWFWHMPRPYEATFTSTSVYWCMHLTLFGSAIWLWREILQSDHQLTVDVLAVGALSSMQMGLLGAVLTMAGHPLFFPHLTTTQAWGLTPLEDQQLGGVFMWVPGIALFLWAALRSLQRLRGSLEELGRT